MKKRLFMVMALGILISAIACGCGKKADEGDAEEKNTKQAELAEDEKDKDGDGETEETIQFVQYVPDTDMLALDDRTNQVYVTDVLLFETGMMNSEVPDEILGSRLIGYDLFTRKYIYEFDSPKSYSELELICQQASEKGVPGPVTIWVLANYGGEDALLDVKNEIAASPMYKYGVYIPDESHIQTNPEGEIRYMDNVIRVSESGLSTEMEIVRTIGGQIVGYDDGWYIIQFDEAKPVDELKALCEEAKTLNKDIPSSLDSNYNIIPGIKITVDADLFFIDPYLQRWPEIELLK